MITLSDIRLAQNNFLGTSETSLYTESRRVDAINYAVREILKRYDINEYTQRVQLTTNNNGVATLPEDFLRAGKLYQNQYWEYLQVDYDRFEYNVPNTFTVHFDAVTERRTVSIYPSGIQTYYLWYIQLPATLSSGGDTVRFMDYWVEAIAAKSVETLLRSSRNYGGAADMRDLADGFIADAWQSDRSFLQGKETQRLQSVFEKRSLLGGWDWLYNGYTITGMGTCMNWVEINSEATAQVNYGYIVNSATDVIVTLPLLGNLGDQIQLIRKEGALGNWRIAQNNGQQIILGEQVTTQGTGGYIESTEEGDAICLICTDTNTQWTAAPGWVGNITYV